MGKLFSDIYIWSILFLHYSDHGDDRRGGGGVATVCCWIQIMDMVVMWHASQPAGYCGAPKQISPTVVKVPLMNRKIYLQFSYVAMPVFSLFASSSDFSVTVTHVSLSQWTGERAGKLTVTINQSVRFIRLCPFGKVTDCCSEGGKTTL